MEAHPDYPFVDHPLCWVASVLCCLGVVGILFLPQRKVLGIYESVTFLPTYTIGILSWFLFGVSLQSTSLIIPCLLQLLVLPILIARSIKHNNRKTL